jgi:serine/threonine protein kinase
LDFKHIAKHLSSSKSTKFVDKKGNESEVAYIASELIPNGELFSYLANGLGGLPDSIIKHYARQIMLALTYTHQMGYAHRDLKCENILLDANFDIKLVDFGFACPITGDD